MEPATKRLRTRAITTRRTRRSRRQPRPRGTVSSDPPLQCLLPGTNTGAFGGRSPDRGFFVRPGNVVEPGLAGVQQRPIHRRRVRENLRAHGNRAVALPRVRFVRHFAAERQAGSGVPPVVRSRVGGSGPRRGEPLPSRFPAGQVVLSSWSRHPDDRSVLLEIRIFLAGATALLQGTRLCAWNWRPGGAAGARLAGAV